MTSENRQAIAAQIEIETPPPAVWNVFRDLEGWPVWNTVCKEARWLKGASWHKNSTAEFTLHIGDKDVTIEARLVEDDFPWLIVFESSIDGVAFTRKFDLDYTGRKTIQFDTTSFEESADAAAVTRLRPDLEAMVQASLVALKAEVERVGVDGIWDLTSRTR
jgi:uncharacterized membrane protein